MKQILTVSQMRESDRLTIKSGVSSVELMKRAAEAVFEESKLCIHGKTAIVCGKGNNGGDGYALALLIKANNRSVTIFALDDNVSEDALFFKTECIKESIEILDSDFLNKLLEYETIYDCIFGTGFKGTPQGIYATAIEKINKTGSFVISVDINSGLDGNNGLGSAFVKSNLTISIQNFQPGHFLSMAKDAIGQLKKSDIGIKPVNSLTYLLESSDVAELLQRRPNFSSKSDYGYIALIGGCRAYSGAVKLAAMANASLRMGSGVVMLALPRCITNSVMPYILETTLYPLSDNGDNFVFKEEEFGYLISRFKTIGFGMGIGNTEETQKALVFILKNYDGNLLIDADGLNALSALDVSLLDNAKCKTVLTPHLREFSRLSGLSDCEILSDPIEKAKDFALKHKVTLLLKGPSTVITDGKTTYLVDKGCAGMATAGSGDVLSGILTSLLGYSKKEVLYTIACGAFIAGLSGQFAQEKMGDISMTAGDTVKEISGVLQQIRNEYNT